MKLFYVADSNDDGDNFDLFVIADTVEEVETVWQEYYGRGDEIPNFIYRVAAAAPVGYHEKPQALRWRSGDLPRVGGYAPGD